MKLSYLQLEPHLSKKLAPAYIVSGSELLLKQDANNLIRKAAAKAGYERTRLVPEAGFDWEQLYSILHSNSLFSEKRLLEIDCNEITLPKIANSILKEYAAQPSLDTILLIDIGKIDDKIAKSSWYGALEKLGVVITIWPVPREQLPQWISQRCQRYKISMTPDAANLLADFVEGNLSAAAAAIEKIYLLKPAQAIDAELINTILTDDSRFTIFDLVENLIGGNKARSLHILDNLIEEGTEPVLILWAITRELRLLAGWADELMQGQTYEMIFQKHRIFARRQLSVRRFLSKMTATECGKLLCHAANIDKVIKGAIPGKVQESLQLFCLRLV